MSLQFLPQGYKEIFSIDLQKNKKLARGVNIASFIIAVIMGIIVNFYIPVTALFDMSDGLGAYTVRFWVLIVLMVAYIILHELVHGIAMKIFGTKKVKYGFTGLYAYAGSSDYYNKKSYIIIALAPIVVWGIIIAAVNLLVPYEWFWVVYLIQIINISGAAGDIYVSAKFSKFPKDILVQDSGMAMTVYSAE